MRLRPAERTVLNILSSNGELRGLDLVRLSGGRLRRGTVYVTLSGLSSAGLVRVRRPGRRLEPDDPERLRRPLYSITEAGRDRLRREPDPALRRRKDRGSLAPMLTLVAIVFALICAAVVVAS